jgi:hypothetical protein
VAGHREAAVIMNLRPDLYELRHRCIGPVHRGAEPVRRGEALAGVSRIAAGGDHPVRALGARWNWFRDGYGHPSPSTIRAVFAQIDVEELERRIGAEEFAFVITDLGSLRGWRAPCSTTTPPCVWARRVTATFCTLSTPPDGRPCSPDRRRERRPAGVRLEIGQILLITDAGEAPSWDRAERDGWGVALYPGEDFSDGPQAHRGCESTGTLELLNLIREVLRGSSPGLAAARRIPLAPASPSACHDLTQHDLGRQRPPLDDRQVRDGLARTRP